jgi:uncharacterized membrane protein
MKFEKLKKSSFLQQTIFWSLLFFIVNLMLRFFCLTVNPLSGDEPFSLYHAQMSASTIFSELSKGNNPPLFELLLHYWIDLKDISINWVRILPLIFSALTASFVFILARELQSLAFAIFVTLLYTFSTYHLQFGQEIRVYSLFGLLTIVSMWIFVRILKNTPNIKWWISFTLVNIFLIYAHYFGFFVLFIQTLFFLFTAKKKEIIHYLFYVLVMVTLYIPMLAVLLNRFLQSQQNMGWLAPPTSIEALYDMLWRFSNKPVVTVLCIALLIAAFLKWLISKNKTISRTSKLFLIWFGISFFGMFLISFKTPMFLDRYLIYGSFSYLFLIVNAIYYLFSQPKIRLLTLGIITALFISTFQLYKPTNRNPPFISKTVKEANKNGYQTIISPPDYIPTFTYYFDINWFTITDTQPIYFTINKKLKDASIFFVYDYNEVKTESKKWLYIDVASNLIVANNHVLENLHKTHLLVKEEKLDEITKAYYFEK